MVGTHVLGCNGVEVPLATYIAMDVSLVFDHVESVADVIMRSGKVRGAGGLTIQLRHNSSHGMSY